MVAAIVWEISHRVLGKQTHFTADDTEMNQIFSQDKTLNELFLPRNLGSLLSGIPGYCQSALTANRAI